VAPAARAVSHAQRQTRRRLGATGYGFFLPNPSSNLSGLLASTSSEKNRAETDALRLHGERAVVGQVGVQTRQGAKVRQPMQRIMWAGEMKREIPRGSCSFPSLPAPHGVRPRNLQGERWLVLATENPDYHR